MKNILEYFFNRLEDAEEWISNLEDRVMESNQAKRQKEKATLKNEDRLKDLCDLIKPSIIWIIGVPKEKRHKEAEKLFEEITIENLPNLEKEIDI